jgi:hypothetical protein
MARIVAAKGAWPKTSGCLGQARAKLALTMMAACYKLQRLVYRKKAAVQAL